jgi:hypothetical protein
MTAVNRALLAARGSTMTLPEAVEFVKQSLSDAGLDPATRRPLAWRLRLECSFGA